MYKCWISWIYLVRKSKNTKVTWIDLQIVAPNFWKYYLPKIAYLRFQCRSIQRQHMVFRAVAKDFSLVKATYFTARQLSCGKVMSSVVRVCPCDDYLDLFKRSLGSLGPGRHPPPQPDLFTHLAIRLPPPPPTLRTGWKAAFGLPLKCHPV